MGSRHYFIRNAWRIYNWSWPTYR